MAGQCADGNGCIVDSCMLTGLGLYGWYCLQISDKEKCG